MTATCSTLACAAVLVGSMLLAGCYLSHERLDDSVPPSACVDDEATVALTPANRTPGSCQRLDVLVEPDTTCHYPPQPPGGRPGETGFTIPERWRGVRFVNTTDSLAVAKIELSGAACSTSEVACRAMGWAHLPCTCPPGVALAAVGPRPDGADTIIFQVDAHAEVQFIVTGTNAHVALTLCDSW